MGYFTILNTDHSCIPLTGGMNSFWISCNIMNTYFPGNFPEVERNY